MAGINTGILTNAYPLTTEQIKALEERALTTKETFVYLDEQGKICFTGNINPDILKDLAWHNTYELKTSETGLLVKNVYTKQSKDTFKLKETLQKVSINDDVWDLIYSSVGILNESLLDDFILE